MLSSLFLATCLLTTHAVELKTTPRPNEQAVNNAVSQTVEDYIGSLADQITVKPRPPPVDTSSRHKKPYAVGVRWWHGESNQEPNLQELASKRRKLRKVQQGIREEDQQGVREEDQQGIREEQATSERPRLSIPTLNRKGSGYVTKSSSGGYNVGPMWPCKTDVHFF